MNKEKLFSEVVLLRDEVVSLHTIEAKDGEQLFKIYSDPLIFKYCGILNKNNRETVINMIPHFKRDVAKQSRIKWGIFLNEGDLLMGILEVMEVNQITNSLTLGYYLHPDYWNKGFTKRAVALLLCYLFKEIGVNRIAADVMPENEYSKKVLLANGFVKEGLIRQGALWPGKGIIDLEKYSILRQDYFQ
jgi:ribosomal-protein-alanine N-acetyltransferase